MTMPFGVEAVWSCRANTARVIIGNDTNIYVTEDRLRSTDERPFMLGDVDGLIDALVLAKTVRDMEVEKRAGGTTT